MTTLLVEFDDSTWQWHLGISTGTSPAGVASFELADGVAVHAEMVSGELLELVADGEDGRGRLSPEVEAVLGRILGGQPLKHGVTRELEPTVEATLGRLAVLVEVEQDRALLGPTSGWWDIEAEGLWEELDLTAPEGVPGCASRRRANPPEAAEVDQRVDRWQGVFDAVAGATTGPAVVVARPAIESALSPERADLGHIRGSRVFLDPSAAPVGLLDLRNGALVARTDDGIALRVTVPMRPGNYATALDRVAFGVVLDDVDQAIALAPLRPDFDRELGAVVAGDLVVSRRRSLDRASVVLVPSSTLWWPSAGLRRLRRDRERARIATSRARVLGELDASVGAATGTLAPFAGELVDLAVTGAEA